MSTANTLLHLLNLHYRFLSSTRGDRGDTEEREALDCFLGADDGDAVVQDSDRGTLPMRQGVRIVSAVAAHERGARATIRCCLYT